MLPSEFEDMFREEELSPELEPYIMEGSFGPYINHPLVQSIPHSPVMNRRANQMLVHKKEALETAIAEGKWHSVVFLHERPFRLNAFLEHVPELPPEQYWPLVSSVWTDSENIWQNVDVWMDLWSADHHRHDLVMDEDEMEAFNALPDLITVYRGSQSGLPIGLSWTTDHERAEWFANRYGQDNAMVFEGKINKAHVLAYFLGRGEQEIVAFPHDVVVIE